MSRDVPAPREKRGRDLVSVAVVPAQVLHGASRIIVRTHEQRVSALADVCCRVDSGGRLLAKAYRREQASCAVFGGLELLELDRRHPFDAGPLFAEQRH